MESSGELSLHMVCLWNRARRMEKIKFGNKGYCFCCCCFVFLFFFLKLVNPIKIKKRPEYAIKRQFFPPFS